MALIKPNSEQAEKAILGAMLLDETKVSHCCTILNSEDFYFDTNRTIFEAMKDLYTQHSKVDVTSVTDKLQDQGLLDKCGGVSGLVDLSEGVTIDNVAYYIEILKDKTNLRTLSDFLEDTYQNFNELALDNPHEYMNKLEDTIKRISNERSSSDFHTSKELTKAFSQSIMDSSKPKTCVSTGFKHLNAKLNGGFQNGSLNILAANTGVGKSALAVNFALNAAKIDKRPVAFFTLEMGGQELIGRMVSILSSLDNKKIATLDIKSNEDLMRVESALEKLQDYPIYIDDSPYIALPDLLAKARKLHSEHPNLGLIIVDYLQIVGSEVAKGSTDAKAIGKVATSLKALARDLDLPVLAVAQLGRYDKGNYGNKSTERRPNLSDIKDSSQIEMDADTVLFLWKQSFYQNDSVDNNEAVELIVKKNRNGSKGTIYLVGTPKYFQFKEALNQDQKPSVSEE